MESNTDDGDPIARAKHLLEDGVRHYQSGGFTEALELWQQAQSLFSKPGLTDLAEADALKADLAMNEGNALRSLDRLDEALAAYARSWALYARPHLVARPELDGHRADLSMNERIVLGSLGRRYEVLVSREGKIKPDAEENGDLIISAHFPARCRAFLSLIWDSVILAQTVAAVLGKLVRSRSVISASVSRCGNLVRTWRNRTNGDFIARAKILHKDGKVRFELSHFVEALELWRQAQTLLSKPDLIDRAELDPLRARLAMNEGLALKSLGRLEEALSAYARARRLYALPHLAANRMLNKERAFFVMLEGETLASFGRFDEALAVYAEALEVWLQAQNLLSTLGLIDRADTDTFRATLALQEGIALGALGRFEEALAASARARDLLALPHLAARAELAGQRANLALQEGIILGALGRFEEALAASARTRDLQALSHLPAQPEQDYEQARLDFIRGVALAAFDRHEEALAAYARARDLYALPHLAARPELDIYRAMLAISEGEALGSLSRFDQALSVYAGAWNLHALPHLAARPELDDRRAALAMSEGHALASLGRFEEALLAYARAHDLHALPHLVAHPELYGERAQLAINEGHAFFFLGRREEALSAYHAASTHWSSQRNLPLPEQSRFARCLALMSGLLDEMAVEDLAAARAWALQSSDRLVEMLDLALPEGKVWDDLRGHFATFHAQWLAWCLGSGEAADRSLVPRVLAAVQGRRLVTETLEQTMALGEAAAPEMRDVLAIKAEMRALLEVLRAAERADDPGAAGRAGPGPSATRGGDAAVGFGRPPRDADRIAAIRAQLQSARDRLTAAKRVAAELPEFAILAAPLSGIGTTALAATLAPDEVLVLAFPTAGDKAKPQATSALSETEDEACSSTPFWLWALRSGGSDPVVLRVGAGATEDAPSSLPGWAGSLPGVVDRWEQFSAAMGGRGGVRRGDLDREAAAGAVPVAAEATSRALSPTEMSSFWSDLDAALASLVWEPLAATGVLDGVEDILIATVGSLHNLPFSVGRRGAAAEARLLHQSSLASFARSRGLLGARPVAPETLAKVWAGTGTADGTARRPVVTLLAAEADAPGQEIPLARAERRIAARVWTAAGAEVRLGDHYPLDPDAPVALAHAACHGMTATPRGGTRGAHLLLRSEVSERTLLAGKPAGAWLMGACVGGQVHDDALDGNPTGIVAGALAAGSETVVAALPPLPDREAFFFGVLVTLQLAHPPIGVAAPMRDGPADESEGPIDLVTAAALAAAIVGGAREVTEVERILPRRSLAALGGKDAIARRLAWLDAGLRWTLAGELAETQGAALVAAMTSGRDDGSAAPLPRPQRKWRIIDALTSADPALALCRAGSGALPERVTLALAAALAVPAVVAASEPGSSLADQLTRALLSLPGAFAVLPDPANPDERNPAAEGAIAHGIVTFHDPGHASGATKRAAMGAGCDDEAGDSRAA